MKKPVKGTKPEVVVPKKAQALPGAAPKEPIKAPAKPAVPLGKTAMPDQLKPLEQQMFLAEPVIVRSVKTGSQSKAGKRQAKDGTANPDSSTKPINADPDSGKINRNNFYQ